MMLAGHCVAFGVMHGTTTLRAGGRTVEISRPDKALFPGPITKLELARHYETVAERMLAQISQRPLTLERYPDGIEHHRIMQQHASKHFPDWIGRVVVPKKGGSVEHVRAADAATLIYLANQATVTLHAWLSRRDRIERPDRLIVDLDPSRDDPASVRRGARLIGDLLRELGLEPWAMTTGSRGYHVVVALQRRHGFDEVRGFARELAALAALREPKLFTTEQRKANREEKILVDVARNGYAQTAVAPYSVRARAKAPVATPLHWEELSDRAMRADRFTVRTIARRLAQDGDPWAQIAARPARLNQAADRLRRLRAEAES
jgi:bifunctional non-homologous end joining protein LigD